MEKEKKEEEVEKVKDTDMFLMKYVNHVLYIMAEAGLSVQLNVGRTTESSVIHMFHI